MRQSIRHGKAYRSSFTLIELLVVIAIIAILISLTASAVIKFITTQQIKNTDATIKKVSDELNRQYAEVFRPATKSDPPPCQTASDLSGGDPAIARVIHNKLRLKQEFPMSYYEVYYPVVDPFQPPGGRDLTIPPIKEYIDKLQPLVLSGAIVIDPNATPTQEENAACLVLALERHRGGRGTSLEDLLGPGVIGTNSVGLRIIKDSWDQPIVFFRWATGNPEVDASGPGPSSTPPVPILLRDPQDPEGKLQQGAPPALNGWWQTSNRFYYEAACHLVSTNNGASPYAYYMPPVIASGGPNKKLGIAFYPASQGPNVPPYPMTITTADDANDNLYSFRLRLGGKGD